MKIKILYFFFFRLFTRYKERIDYFIEKRSLVAISLTVWALYRRIPVGTRRRGCPWNIPLQSGASGRLHYHLCFWNPAAALRTYGVMRS